MPFRNWMYSTGLKNSPRQYEFKVWLQRDTCPWDVLSWNESVVMENWKQICLCAYEIHQ